MDLAESLAGLDELALLRRRADKLGRELGQAEARLLVAQDCRETAEGKRWARDLAPLLDEERRRLRVLFVADSNGSSCRYRCVNACEQLRQAGVIANVSRLDSPRLLAEEPSYSTVVLLQLGWCERVERVVEAARAAGAVVALDLPEPVSGPGVEPRIPFPRRLPDAGAGRRTRNLSSMNGGRRHPRHQGLAQDQGRHTARVPGEF